MNPERLNRLYERRTFGIKPGLQVIAKLLAELGNPQRNLRVIHVAGTNGKGSVSAMLTSVLSQTGVPVGLYTSPHLVRLNERFRIGEEEISDAELDALCGEVEEACGRMEQSGEGTPTFFECTTALCLLWWKRRGVSLAVVETGMGGRLDATNVLEKLLCVITRIGLDHTQYLGDTMEKIAREKAGILRSGVPAVLGAMPEEAEKAIAEVAEDLGAPCYQSARNGGVRRIRTDAAEQKFEVETESENYGTLTVSLPGAFQAENVATVITALEVFGGLIGVSFTKELIAAGLKKTCWPGRFQRLCEDPPVYLDGGHNPDAAAAQVAALKAVKAAHGVRLVVGQCGDKDSEEYLRALKAVSDCLWAVPLENSRGLVPEVLAEKARQAGFSRVTACTSVAEGIEKAKSDAREAGAAVLICGSLFLAGEVLAGR